MALSQIVFLQGSEADDALLEYDGEDGDGDFDALFRYLVQWDTGDDFDVREESTAGPDDDSALVTVADQKWLVSVNDRIGYVSLQRYVEQD